MTHSKLQKLVIQAMLVHGNGFNIVSSNKRGVPDVLGHIGKVFLAIEVKVKTDRLRPAQRATILAIVNRGGLGIVVHEKHYRVFLAYIERLVDEQKKCLPINTIGLPIPPELVTDPFDKVLSVTAELL